MIISQARMARRMVRVGRTQGSYKKKKVEFSGTRRNVFRSQCKVHTCRNQSYGPSNANKEVIARGHSVYINSSSRAHCSVGRPWSYSQYKFP